MFRNVDRSKHGHELERCYFCSDMKICANVSIGVCSCKFAKVCMYVTIYVM